MKRNLLSILLIFVALAVNAQKLTVGSYNVRYDNPDDRAEGNAWTTRVRMISDLVNFEDLDIFGTQEAKVHQVNDLLHYLDGYDYLGIGREDGKQKGEYSAIFYKKGRLECLDHGNFWLSELPDRPGLGWDAACIRICTWGKFKVKESGLKIYFFNLHMDHVGTVARREAAKLAIRKIKEIAGEKANVILTGDFNVDQHDEIYTIFSESGLLRDSYAAARQRMAWNGTFNDFKTQQHSDSRIDHVFVSRAFSVAHYGILTNMYWTAGSDTAEVKSGAAPKELSFNHYVARTPSDHYPVVVKLEY